MKHPVILFSARCRRVLVGLALPAALAASLPLSSGCKPATATATPKQEPEAVSVRLARAQKGEITRFVALPARVAANQQVVLYSKVAGYLKRIAVDKGDSVIAGQVLAEIEVPELLAESSRCEAEVELAALEHKRATDAQKKAPDLVTLQSIDVAQSKLKIAQANMERVQTQLRFCRIIAPFAGVITRRSADPGAFIPVATSGSAAPNAAVVTLTDYQTVRVQVAVPEPEVPLIQQGLPVKVLVEELPGRVFTGVVTRFAHVLDDATRTMLTEVDLPNPSGELRPGMFATAKIGLETRTNSTVLPAEAVVFEKTGPSVFTVVDSKARKIAVKTGFQDGSMVEILEGLQPDAPAILVGKLALANGTPVTVAASK